MNKGTIAACIILIAHGSVCMNSEASGVDRRTVTVEELASGSVCVIGALGVPLGRVVDVEGTLVRASDTLGPLHASGLLFRIETVGGVKVATPILMEFQVKDDRANLPETLPEAVSWKGHELGRALTEDETEAVSRSFLGRRYRVFVVENGWFTGLPKNLPKDCVLWSAPAYGFQTTLEVIGVASQTEHVAEPNVARQANDNTTSTAGPK